MGQSVSWSSTLRLSDLARGAQTLEIEPPAEVRSTWARLLALKSLPSLSARITVRPWLDGAELTGRFRAQVEQICGVTLEPFVQGVEGQIDLRVVPRGSPNTPAETHDEIELDPEAPDPPDVLEGETIDLGHVVFEHLALEIDPFPRKPDAVFDYAAPSTDLSPFSVLKQLRDREP